MSFKGNVAKRTNSHKRIVIRGEWLKRNGIAWAFILPSLLLMFLFSWRPIFVGTYLSFFEMKGYTPVKFIGLENYRVVLSDTHFLSTLSNTFQYVFLYAILGFLVPVILAIMINEMRHMQKGLKFAIYFPAIMPAIVTSMIWRLLYYPDATGLLNNILLRLGLPISTWLDNPRLSIFLIVISMIWNSAGSTMIYYLAALQGINQELYEAAIIDGAGFFTRILKITIPRISGVMLLFFVRMILNIFQVMEQPLAMTDGGPNGASLTMALQSYRYAFQNYQVGYSLALGVITFLMLIVLTAFYLFVNKKVGNDE